MQLKKILFESDISLSEETRNWLQSWTETAPKGLPSDKIIRELKPYRPSQPKMLWRYVQTIETESQKQLLSWLPSINRVLDAFFEGPSIYVKVAMVDPKDILVDMQLVVDAYPEMNNIVLREEIITYQI